MAHFAKYTQSQVGHLFNHYNRDKEKEVERSNKNIDREETHNNYNLMERDVSPQEYFNQRLGELYHMNRADINVMVDVIVTLPKDYKGDSREFFSHTVDFLNSRYGADNCIGAFVHMDEKNPHLHYSFIPVTPDRKHKDYEHKVNAKAVVSRTELKAFHPELQSYLRERMPDRTINIYQVEKDRVKDLSIKEFKNFKEQQRIDRLEQKLHEREVNIQSKEKDITERERASTDREKSIADREKSYERYMNTREDYCREHGLTEHQYERQVFFANRGEDKYPLPEVINPTRSDKERQEIRDFYKKEQERTVHTKDREEPTHERDR